MDQQAQDFRTRAERLAAQVFDIPILQSLILSFADRPTLARCAVLDAAIHGEAVNHLYKDPGCDFWPTWVRSCCDHDRQLRYLNAVYQPCFTTAPNTQRLRLWYPNLRRYSFPCTLDGSITLTLGVQGHNDDCVITECDMATISLIPRLLESANLAGLSLRCERLAIGPAFSSPATPSDARLESDHISQELMDLERLPLESLRELRLSGFCLNGEDLLRILSRTPLLERLEFYGGLTEIQEPLSQQPGDFDHSNGLIAAKITKQCPHLKELAWHQCTEHRSNSFVMGCVQTGLENLEILCIPWSDMLSSNGTERARQNSAGWLHTLSNTGVPWTPSHTNLKKVRLEMHPDDARLSNPFDLAVSLLLDFHMYAKIEIGFRPSRHHVGTKSPSTRDTGTLSNLEVHNMAIFKSALEIRHILIASMPPRAVGFSLLPRVEGDTLKHLEKMT